MSSILVLVIVVGAIALVRAVWFIFYTRRLSQEAKAAQKAQKPKGIPFRWNYIILPVAILALSIILSVYFYYRLPAEVAYHFKLDGTPDRWFSREMTLVWALTPQLFLVILAGAITWGITKLGVLTSQRANTVIKPQRILSLMGNLLALPQLLVGFVMFDIFSYNLNQKHLMPMWVFLLIILGLATIALGLFIVFIYLKSRQEAVSQPEDQS